MILLTVDEDPAVIEHTLGILKKLGGHHEVHTASNLGVAENSAKKLEALDVLIVPAIASSGESFFELRDTLRDRFEKLHVLFLNDYDVSDYEEEIGTDTVLPRQPSEGDLTIWANSIGFGILPESRGGPEEVDPNTEPLLEASPQSSLSSDVPVAVASSVPAVDESDEEIPVAGLVTPPADSLGDYKLVRVIASHEETETHEAVQLSIGRTVALVLLKPEFCNDNDALREFRGAVRAKAAVSHPYITPVYEAHEEDGSIFYTRELVEGLNLPQLASTGKKLNQRTLVQIVRTTAECMRFMRSDGIRHVDLEPRHIYLGQDAQVRLTNIAALNPKNQSNPAKDIAKMATSMRPLISNNPAKNDHILPLLDRMEAEEFDRWLHLLTEAQELSNKIDDSQTYSVSGRKPPGGAATSGKSLALIGIAAIALIAIAAALFHASRDKPEPVITEEMPKVPAGRFIFGEKEKRRVQKPFWIDKYEVTIGQYAEFLKALDDSSNATAYDHRLQAGDAPQKNGHTPDDWDNYYAAAKANSTYLGSRIGLNYPVMLVDWWDAHAYAKWKGHRLPTEDEWAKAARGKEGNLFPWGNTPDSSKFNSSADTDSYAMWAPTNAFPADISPFGVVATCGNVSEWTATTDTHPDFPDSIVPIVRGGNFASPEERYPLSDRRHATSAEDRNIYTGFRTVSDNAPAAK